MQHPTSPVQDAFPIATQCVDKIMKELGNRLYEIIEEVENANEFTFDPGRVSGIFRRVAQQLTDVRTGDVRDLKPSEIKS